MIITINTDASFSNTHNIGTYAFWIASNKGKLFRSGALKGKIYSSTHAEMKCIINAMHQIFNDENFKNVTRIIVNTDCLFLIDKFEDPYKDWISSKKIQLIHESNAIKNKFKKIYNSYFSDKPNKFKIKIEYRHVKAHSHTENARHFVNDFCDKEAKKQMGLLLKTIKKPKNKKHGFRKNKA